MQEKRDNETGRKGGAMPKSEAELRREEEKERYTPPHELHGYGAESQYEEGIIDNTITNPEDSLLTGYGTEGRTAGGRQIGPMPVGSVEAEETGAEQVEDVPPHAEITPGDFTREGREPDTGPRAAGGTSRSGGTGATGGFGESGGVGSGGSVGGTGTDPKKVP